MNHDHGAQEEISSAHVKMASVENNPGACNLRCKMENAQDATAKWPGVKMREKRPQTTQEKSETQRKRNSKNRLSNRRSTGFVTPEEIEAAMTLQATENF